MVNVAKIEVLARCANAGDYHMIYTYQNTAGDTTATAQLTASQNATYGGLNKVSVDVGDPEDMDIAKPMTLKLKRSTAAAFTELVTDPKDEVQDLFLVVHYKLSDLP